MMLMVLMIIISAACRALAELGRSGPLPLEAGEVKETKDAGEINEDKEMKEVNGETEAASHTKLHLVTKLLALVKSGKTSMKVWMMNDDDNYNDNDDEGQREGSSRGRISVPRGQGVSIQEVK